MIFDLEGWMNRYRQGGLFDTERAASLRDGWGDDRGWLDFTEIEEDMKVLSDALNHPICVDYALADKRLYWPDFIKDDGMNSPKESLTLFHSYKLWFSNIEHSCG